MATVCPTRYIEKEELFTTDLRKEVLETMKFFMEMQ